MFFFGVFGVQGKEKEIRELNNVTCKACESFSSYKLIKTYNYFHLFFLPVFNWGMKYYLVSRCCSSIFQISNDLGKALEDGQNVPVKDEDLTQVYNDRYYKREKRCPNCSRRFDEEFQYCPHCGRRI